ncbi:hypothetical protein [Rhizobium sp. Rhizsp82]|uniref:hypothetical protein n=1 Tax=Rhizobium sp. Rhizsp82 TaxID=3243057 RepID=UPI0039B624D0
MYIFDTVMGWSIRQRWELYTVEDGRPVFTSCKPAIVSTYRGVPAMYIEADWRRGNLHALATVILSSGASQILRVDRHFIGHSPFRTDETFGIWENRRDWVEKPNAKPDLPW